MKASDGHQHHHGHSFDPENWRKLESDERRSRMDPARLAHALGLTGNEVVLDIGVGTGYFAEALAPLCRKVIGVDHSPRMLEIFRSKEGFARLTNVDLLEGKAEKLPVEDRSVDLAFHANLFHEIGDMKAFHQEIHRVLKPGGRLALADWRAIPTAGGPPPEHRISEERAIEILKRDGFGDIRSLSLYEDHYVLLATTK